MDALFATLTGLVVCLTVLPLMMRLAPRLQLLDRPDHRKVHLHPIPRVGGWGMVLGAITSILLWLPLDRVTVGFTIGALILLLGGAADDRKSLRASIKLLIQGAAAIPVVVIAGLAVDTLPLFGELHLPAPLAMTLTAVGLAACINATNTSDGLDGLAGGVTLLSLAGILYITFMTADRELLLITAATLGGLCGFLRYNTHPAAVFMGDSGSQFLGFAVGVLGLAVVQSAELSPWTLLLLLGLPPADLAIVAARRIMRGEPWFKADKSHLHHRLMDVGFSHAQSVILIYALQASFIFFAVALQSSQHWKIVLVYLLHLIVIYGFLTMAETAVRRGGPAAIGLTDGNDWGSADARPLLVWAPRVALETLTPLVLVVCAILATTTPRDLAVVGALVLAPLLAVPFTGRRLPLFVHRMQAFVVASAALYLYTGFRPFVSSVSRLTEIAAFSAIAVLVFVTVRYCPMRRKQEFRITAMDYLLVIIAVLTILSLQGNPTLLDPYFLVYLPITLYASEIIMVERRERTNWLLLATWATALILLVRGLLP